MHRKPTSDEVSSFEGYDVDQHEEDAAKRKAIKKFLANRRRERRQAYRESQKE